MTPIPFFLIPLLIATATVLPPGETVIENDTAELAPDETLDLSVNVEDKVGEITETIGGQEVELTKEVTLHSTDGGDLTIENTAETNLSVEIPDETIISAPDEWDGEITPPKTVSTSGTIEGNFLTPTSSILVGSPDVVLVFDSPVTLVLNGISGTIAYKTPGSTEWIIISGCTGTFANPDPPASPGECSIGDGTNTKVITFHFTEFSGLSASTPSSTPATSTPAASSSGSSGGHGRTGVGPSSGGGSYSIKQSNNQIPDWFSDVILWQKQGLISSLEMLNAWKWLMAQ